MPSVGMIRSTRVFVPKSPSSTSSSSSVMRNSKIKLNRSGSLGGADRRFKVEESDWFNDKLNNFTSNKVVVLNQQYESIMMEFSKETQSTSSLMDQEAAQVEENDVKGSVALLSSAEVVKNKRFGNVYSRKRRKLITMKVERDFFCNEGRRFGKQFVRKQFKKRGNLALKELKPPPSLVILDEDLENLLQPVKESVVVGGGGVGKRGVLSFVMDTTTSLDGVYQFLNSILGYMCKKNSRLRLSRLAAFLTDQTVSRVFSSLGGIHLLQDSLSSPSSGNCRIRRSRNNVPIFCMDFSAVPFLFMRMHRVISFKSQRLPKCLETYLEDSVASRNSSKKRKVDEITGGSKLCVSLSEKKRSCSKRVFINPLSTVFYSDILNSDGPFFASSDDWISPAISSCEPKQNKRSDWIPPPISGCEPKQNKKSDWIPPAISGCEPKQNKKKSDWIPPAISGCEPKQNKKKSPPPFCHFNTEAVLDWIPQDLEPKHKKRKLSCRDPTYDPNSELDCEPKQNRKKSSLILKIKKEVDLDWTPQGLVVPKHKKRKSRDPTYDPSSELKSAVVDSETEIDVSSANLLVPKLENCYRNSPVELKEIHVPIFREVPDYVNCDYVPFVQPGAYITSSKDNEVNTALNRKVAIYDADSGDEEWLRKRNDHRGENSVSLEKFEEMIDAFEKDAYNCSTKKTEKAAYNRSSKKIDESKVTTLCPGIGTKLAVDVLKYWLKKRKWKHTPVLRVFGEGVKFENIFQKPPAKKVHAAGLDKPVLRKKRSIKKKSERPGRGVNRRFMQEFVPEFNPVKIEHEEDEARLPCLNPVKKEHEARRFQKDKEDEARRIQKDKEDEARRIQKDKEDEARRLKLEKERVAREEKMQKAREDDLRKSEAADILRVEQATKAAQEKLEVALQKRQRAQNLMVYADLALEWATKAEKMSEAIQMCGSSEVAASYYLDD